MPTDANSFFEFISHRISQHKSDMLNIIVHGIGFKLSFSYQEETGNDYYALFHGFYLTFYLTKVFCRFPRIEQSLTIISKFLHRVESIGAF